MIEKVINVEAKVSLQSPLVTKKIDFKCLKDYRLTKKDKNEANREYQDGNKAKSHNLSPINTNQSQAHVFKKDKRHQGNC